MPDHDTVMYTLAGLANRELGLGPRGRDVRDRRDARAARRGDAGSASAIATSRRTSSGRRGCGPALGLTDVCLGLQRSLGVAATILPMSDAPVRTEVRTDDGLARVPGLLRRTAPGARGPRGALPRGSSSAAATPEVEAAIAAADAIVIAPSNPIVSIGPILAVRGIRDALAAARGARRAGRRRVRDHRRQGAQGAGRPDARVARPRVERARCRPDPCRRRDGLRARHGRRGARRRASKRSGCGPTSPTRS